MSLKLCSQPFGNVDNQYVEKATAFANEFIRKNADEWEINKEQPDKIMRMAIKEFTKLVVSKKQGGIGASKSTIVRVLEELAKADLGLTFALAVHNNVTWGMSMMENEALRDQYVPKLMSGEMIGSFLFSEPKAGTDAVSMKSTAVEEDGKWVINGSKAWVTNSVSTDMLLTFAQTSEGPKGIVGFVVEKDNPGVKKLGNYDMMGAHAMATGEIELNNCVVKSDKIAFPGGAGIKAAMAAIDIGRLGVAAMCNGTLMGCLEESIGYLKDRVAFGAPLIKRQGLQWKLANISTNLEASRMLNFQAAEMVEQGVNTTLIVSHSKKFAVDTAYDGVSSAMQLMGANGLKREYPLVRQLTALAITFNTDGTNDACNLVIGKSLSR
jgi:alkylation response protein AidB-like acyl-CoA dehydrogenase